MGRRTQCVATKRRQMLQYVQRTQSTSSKDSTDVQEPEWLRDASVGCLSSLQ